MLFFAIFPKNYTRKKNKQKHTNTAVFDIGSPDAVGLTHPGGVNSRRGIAKVADSSGVGPGFCRSVGGVVIG